MIDKNTASSDPVVETNVALLRSRSALGVEKYGVTLDKSNAPLRDWLQHALLESLDFSNYIQKAMQVIDAAQDSFQQRVQPWMMACFGAQISADKAERNHRFFEEATELVQSTGMTTSEAHQLVDYVYGRDIGEPAQEVGGVMVTLAALCLANDLDMHDAAEVELARIWTKVEAIRAKQAAKPKHSPLPQAAAMQPDSGRDAALEEAASALEDLCYGAENGGGGTVSERLRQAQRIIRALAAHTPPTTREA